MQVRGRRETGSQRQGGWRPGRTATRRIATGATLTVVAAGVLAGADWTQAATPQQVLQAVNVQLGSNGAITGVSGTDIRKDVPGYTTATTAYAPAKVASSLPISVTTTYLRNGVPGTDVSGLALKDGLIEVDVTVTNKTVRSEMLSYPVDGVQHTQQALVAAPLTVRATATLPKGSFARIVQAAPGTTQSHTTNGVVASDDSGQSTVSWASLLAPPSLSPTTTFTLVEQATKFQMPSFDLAVVPGLNADPSVSGLLARTFGASNPLITTQNQTIALVDQIDATLGDVSGDLSQIQDALGTTASGVGQAASSALQEAGQQIGGSSQALSSELDSLRSTVGSSVSDAGGSAKSQLTDAVNQITSAIGGPDGSSAFGHVAAAGQAMARSVAPSSCAVPTATTATGSLYQQLQQVQQLLTAVDTASAACVGQVQQQLLAAIGTTDSLSQCPADDSTEPTSVVCSLHRAQGQLDSTEQSLASTVTSIDGISTSFDSALSALDQKAAALSTTLGQLANTPTSQQASIQSYAGQALMSAQSISDQLKDLVAGQLTDAKTKADQQVGFLASADEVATGKAFDGNTVAGQAATAYDGLCQAATALVLRADLTTPDINAALEQIYEAAMRLDDAGCASPGTGPALTDYQTAQYNVTHGPHVTLGSQQVGIEKALLASASAWTAVASDVDTLDTDLTSVQQAVAALQTPLTQLASPKDAAGNATALGQLQAAAQALAVVTGSSSAADCTSAADVTSFADLQSVCVKGLQDLVDGLAKAAGTAPTGDSLAAAIDASSVATNAADGELLSLTSALDGALVSVRDKQLSQELAQLTAQQTSLMATAAKATNGLDSATAGAITSLDQQVQGADGAQQTTSAGLQKLIAEVQSDLGTGGGSDRSGILGAISANAAQTGVGVSRIDGATGSASTFSAVRSGDVASNLLTQAQLSEASQIAQGLPAFGGPLPTGSTYSTVYVFHLASIG